MDIMRPRNPFFIFYSLFFPWLYKNTYVALEENKITFSRYYAVSETHCKKKLDEIMTGDLQAAGFPSDLKIKRQECSQSGAKVFYLPQEIDFKTKEKIVALNAKPYTKKQIRFLMEYIGSRNEEFCLGKNVARMLEQ